MSQHSFSNWLAENPDAVCWLCGREPVTLDPLTADHVVPRALGGPNALSNLRPAHRSCNGRRGHEYPVYRLDPTTGGRYPLRDWEPGELGSVVRWSFGSDVGVAS